MNLDFHYGLHGPWSSHRKIDHKLRNWIYKNYLWWNIHDSQGTLSMAAAFCLGWLETICLPNCYIRKSIFLTSGMKWFYFGIHTYGHIWLHGSLISHFYYSCNSWFFFFILATLNFHLLQKGKSCMWWFMEYGKKKNTVENPYKASLTK